MYNNGIIEIFNGQRVFSAGLKLLEFFNLSSSEAKSKSTDEKGCLSYVINSIDKGSTVLDIGHHEDDYLWVMLKIAKRAGKMIVFEQHADLYNHFLRMKQMLKFRNVTIEQLLLSDKAGEIWIDTLFKGDSAAGATIIDFKERINRKSKDLINTERLDDYCIKHNVMPDVLKVSSGRKQLDILQGAIATLQKYKPKILIECEERHGGTEQVLKTFQFLAEMKYSGYFILDTMKLPLANFDFNIYQNPLTDFYCRQFIFE